MLSRVLFELFCLAGLLDQALNPASPTNHAWFKFATIAKQHGMHGCAPSTAIFCDFAKSRSRTGQRGNDVLLGKFDRHDCRGNFRFDHDVWVGGVSR